MTTTTDSRIAATAARQHGMFSRAQVLECGGDDPLIRRRLRHGAWVRIHPGVHAIAGTPESYERDLWAAFLAIGPHATITHETALFLHGVEHVPRRPLTFTVAHGRHPRIDGAFVHQIDDLRPSHMRTSAIGIPISTPARALVECGATLGGKHLLDVVQDAVIVHQLTTYERVSGVLLQVSRPGKPGVSKMAGILGELMDGQPPVGSIAEKRFIEALVARGLPLPDRQVPLPGRGPIEGIVDACYQDERLIVEVDSRRWHTRIRDLKRDQDRDVQAGKAGYQTMRVGWERIVHETEDLCADLSDLLDARRALFDGASRGNDVQIRPLLPRGAQTTGIASGQ
jgi:hypothetical protein